MKIIPKSTLTAFIKANGLTLEINERPLPKGDRLRFYAFIRGLVVKDGPFLISAFGNGKDRHEAKRNLAVELNLKRLVVNAYLHNRKEFGPIRFI